MTIIENKLKNIDLVFFSNCYIRDNFVFKVNNNCSTTTVVKNLVELTQKLKQLDINFVVDDKFNIKIIK